MNINSIEVSVVIPCLNEEETIGICLKKIQEVFSKDSIRGEIIVVDNGSTDKSAQIAQDGGARVIPEPIKGYGAAYLKGLAEAQGKYIIMADADNTYDFYDIPKFLNLLKDGYEFVIGNRFKGKIHKKAMPFLNRYVGNPVLSGLCKLFFKTKLSDFHCGMRGFTQEALKKMHLKCPGMEFATEMVMVALQEKLKTKEIPIEYYERKGESKLNPLSDGWRHLKFMLLFAPSWLYTVPGLSFTGLGLAILLILAKGPLFFLGHTWDIHMVVFASLSSIFGYQLLNLGVYAKTFALKNQYIKEDKITLFFKNHFKLEAGLILGLLLLLLGIGLNIFIILEWLNKSFGALYRTRESILAMTFMILGLQTIFSSFFISLLNMER